METAAIIALTLTYLVGIAWFSLAQWIAIELDGERRVGVSIRIVLAAVWPLTILVATCAVLVRQISDQNSATPYWPPAPPRNPVSPRPKPTPTPSCRSSPPGTRPAECGTAIREAVLFNSCWKSGDRHGISRLTS